MLSAALLPNAFYILRELHGSGRKKLDRLDGEEQMVSCGIICQSNVVLIMRQENGEASR